MDADASKLPIGTRVKITQVYKKERGGNRWRPETRHVAVDFHATGWVVGFRYLPQGHTIVESEGIYKESVWRGNGGVRCVLVALSPYQNPVRVPYNAIELETV